MSKDGLQRNIASEIRVSGNGATKKHETAITKDKSSQNHISQEWLRPLNQEDRERLDALKQTFVEARRRSIGYPGNYSFDFSELHDFIEFGLNNVGDPFNDGNHDLCTHEFEREVIAEFADLTQAPEDVWGYVTACGTEGNFCGLALAKAAFPNGVVYYSEDTHYSVEKIIKKLLKMDCVKVRSLARGMMSYSDFAARVNERRDRPAVVVANIGTTMKGAVDNIPVIRNILEQTGVVNTYIHADAALSGMILPFVKRPGSWNFSDGIDSIAISGHKMLATPFPSGVILARPHHVATSESFIEYIASHDTTILGSRSGHAPLFLWYEFKKLGRKSFESIVKRSIEMARYAEEGLLCAGIEAWRHRNSFTVVFPEFVPALPNWHLATHGGHSHIITMPHVSVETLDEFIEDAARHARRHGLTRLPGAYARRWYEAVRKAELHNTV